MTRQENLRRCSHFSPFCNQLIPEASLWCHVFAFSQIKFSFKAPTKVKDPLCFSAARWNRHTPAAFSLRLTLEHRCAYCHWRRANGVECKINYGARFSDLPGHVYVGACCFFRNSISFGNTASVHFFSILQEPYHLLCGSRCFFFFTVHHTLMKREHTKTTQGFKYLHFFRIYASSSP